MKILSVDDRYVIGELTRNEKDFDMIELTGILPTDKITGKRAKFIGATSMSGTFPAAEKVFEVLNGISVFGEEGVEIILTSEGLMTIATYHNIGIYLYNYYVQQLPKTKPL